MEDLVRAHVIISGRVQGVCFRMETRGAVKGLGGVRGWVRNRRDGTVEAIFEGASGQVQKILAWCRKGPAAAAVSDVAVEWQPYAGEFGDFVITY